MELIREGIEITADASQAKSQVDQLSSSVKGLNTRMDETARATTNVAAGSNNMERGLASLERQIIRMAGAWLIYKGAMEGIKGGDEISTLQRQIDNLAGTVGTGAKAMEFFQSVQERTRASTTELMKVMEALTATNLGPGGFKDPQTLAKFSVELVNAGTAAGVTTPKMLAFWEAVKRGEGARFDKDTISKLKFNNVDLQNLDEVVKRIEELNDKGETMGLTFETALKKVGDQWKIAFGAGMDDNNKTSAYDELYRKLTDPALMNAVRQIGSSVVDVIKGVGGFAQGVVGVIETVFGAVTTAIASIMKFISEKIANTFQALADATPNQFGRLKDWLQGNANSNRADAATQSDLSAYGADKMLEGLNLLKGAFGDTLQASNAFNGSLHTGASGLDVNADKAKKLAEADRKLRAAQDEVNNANLTLDRIQEKISAIGDVEENDTPLERKLRGIQKVYEALNTDLDKVIAKQQSYLNHPHGVEKTILDAAPGLIARAQAEKEANTEANWTAIIAANIDEAFKSTEKFGQALKRVNDTAQELADAVKQVMQQFPNSFSSFITGLPGGINQITQSMYNEVTAAQVNGVASGQTQDQINAQIHTIQERYKQIGQQFIKDNVVAANRWAETFTGPITGLFTDLALTGGKNFGQLAGQMFNKSVSDGMGKFTEILGTAVLGAFGGGPVMTREQFAQSGKSGSYEDYVQNAQNQRDALAGAITGTIGAISKTIDMFQNAAKGQQTSVFGSALSFAAVGASIGTAIAPGLGTVIGAVVGALVGGIMAAIANAKSKKELPYADYGIVNGQAVLQPDEQHMANWSKVTEKEKQDMINQMQSVTDETVSGYVKLLIKLNGTFVDISNVMKGTITPASANYSKELDLLKNWSSDFNAWVNGILPKDIANRFKNEVGTGFEALGMSAQGFSAFWDKVQNLDPKVGMQVLNDVADALLAFQRAAEFSRQIFGSFNSSFGTNFSLTSSGGTTAGKTEFENSIADQSKNLQDLSLQVQTLPFEQAATAAKDLGAGIGKLQADLTSFLNDLLEKSKALSQKIADLRMQAALDQTGGDKNKQSAIYEAKYKQDIYDVQHWKELGLTKEDVNQRLQDMAEQATNIYKLDPTGRYDWYQQQLTQIDTYQKQIFQQIGQNAIDATTQLIASVQPAIDFFKNLPKSDNLGGAFVSLTQSATEAAAALYNVAGQSSSSASQASNVSEKSARSTSGGGGSQVFITVDDPNGYVRDVQQQRLAR